MPPAGPERRSGAGKRRSERFARLGSKRLPDAPGDRPRKFIIEKFCATPENSLYLYDSMWGDPHFFVSYGMQNEQIIARITETAAAAGATLLDCRVARTGGVLDIEVIADTEQGISIGEIATLSRAVQRDLKALLGDPDMQLTVSSPGLERPLEHEWQYRRHAGRPLRVEEKGGRVVDGTIDGASDGALRLRCGGELLVVPLADIARATILLPPTNE
jgi:ribosome maturation factor RimP